MADETGFPIRNLDTGEVYSHSSVFSGVDFDGLAPAASSSAPIATDADNVAFRKMFAAFGKDEKLYHALKCRLWESLSSFHSRKAKKRHQGLMFISSKHLSFAEENAQRKPVKIGIPLNEIVNLSSEDFGLSEGIVVSTMRDTKFYFEQFTSRREAFDAVTSVWNRTAQPQQSSESSSASLSNIFDPLGGFSASVAAAPQPSTSSPSILNSLSGPPSKTIQSSSPKRVSPSVASATKAQDSPRNTRAQPLPSRQPPPPPSKRATSGSLDPSPTNRLPRDNRPSPTQNGSRAVYGVAPSSTALKENTRPKPVNNNSNNNNNKEESTRQVDTTGVHVNRDFVHMLPGDNWFMTLTKIYYRLGKFDSLTIPDEFLDDDDSKKNSPVPATAPSTS